MQLWPLLRRPQGDRARLWRLLIMEGLARPYINLYCGHLPHGGHQMNEGAWVEQCVAILQICIAVLAIVVALDPPAESAVNAISPSKSLD